MIAPSELSQLSVANLTVGGGDPVELIEAAGAAGFGYAGLVLRTAMGKPLAREIIDQPETIRAIKAASAATGVRVFDVEAFVLRPGLDVAAFRPALATGAELGATHISTIGAELAGSDGFLSGAERIDLFGRLCQEAAGFGLHVGVEFMRYRDIATMRDALDLIAAAGNTGAGVIFDMLHFHRTGGRPEDLDGVPPDRIAYVQLCDAGPDIPPQDALSREARTARRHLGDGVIPIDALLDRLPEGKRLVVETPVADDAALSVAGKVARSGDRAKAFLKKRTGRR